MQMSSITKAGAKRILLVAIVSLLVTLTTGTTVLAQTATVTGTLTDASGAGIAAATITARNVDTNAVRDTQSGDTGYFRITTLSPGNYEITIEKNGFRTIKYTAVVLTVGQALTIDGHLEVSTVSQTVEVSGQTVAAIELDNAQISNLVDEKRITELPLITRDPYQLVALSAGTTVSNGLGGFVVNGSRERNNNFLLDGTDNNDTDVPGNPSGVSSLNPDATQEFRVITNNYLPEYGRNTGAIVDIKTKGGTNDFHGNGYWFGRYAASGARDFFNHAVDPLTGQPETKNPFVRNQFGGSLGGPLKKDKFFWFVNYEGQRFVTSRVATSVVPTDALKTGIFTVDGVAIDASQNSPQNVTGQLFGANLALDPKIQQVLSFYPAPNANTEISGATGDFQFPVQSRFQGDNVIARVDYNLSSKHQLTARYTFNRGVDPGPFSDAFLPGLGNTSFFGRTQNASIALTSTLRSNLVNELRFGGNRVNAQFSCGNVSAIDAVGPVDSLGSGTDYVLPGGITDFGCLALVANGQGRFAGTYHTIDNLSWVRGKHTMKFGGEFRDVYSNNSTNFFSRTEIDTSIFTNFGIVAGDADPSTPCNAFTGVGCEPYFPKSPATETAIQDLLWTLHGGVATQFQGQFFNRQGSRTGTDLRGFRQHEFGLFAQDVFKITPHFTLSYGVRYQYYGVPFEVHNNVSILSADPSGSAPFTFQFAGPGTGHQLYSDDLNNWEPRIGIAWDPFKKGKTSIRTGYGMTHDRVFGNLLGFSRGLPPFEQDFFDLPLLSGGSALASSTPVPPEQTPSPTLQDGAGIFPALFNPKLSTPYSQNWNFGIQHELRGNLQVEVNYVGAKGTKLLRVEDFNPPQPELVAQLVAFCSVPGNAFGCTEATLQRSNLYFGAERGAIPFNAVNNNAFFHTFTSTSGAASIYHALQVSATERLFHGLTVQGAYTWSHLIDDASDPIVPTVGNGNFAVNQFDHAKERGNSGIDTRHRFIVNYVYNVPVGRGTSHLGNGFVGRIFEGWEIAGISTFSTGLPYELFGTRDTTHSGINSRLDLVGSPAIPAGSDKTQTGPPASAFALAPFGRDGNLSRNHFYGPGLNNWDVVFSKLTPITERLKLQFRSEFYNIFNHVAFGQPNRAFGSSNFGSSTSQIGRPDGTSGARQIQFALKLIF
jgi:hypothetical protein